MLQRNNLPVVLTPVSTSSLCRRVILAIALSAALATPLASTVVQAASAPSDRPIRIVVLGDSLSSGFLIGEQNAFPAVLEGSLRETGFNVSVANAGVTNDTTWQALARLDRDVPPGTDAVIVELGANDQLLRTDPGVTRSMLEQIIARLRGRHIAVMLAGFRMPFEWSEDGPLFADIYAAAARRHSLLFYPDFYAGMWSDRALTSLDGAHPSADGVRRIVSGIMPTVVRFLRTVRPGGGG